jgi:hypothetical protein
MEVKRWKLGAIKRTRKAQSAKRKTQNAKRKAQSAKRKIKMKAKVEKSDSDKHIV